MGTTGLHPIPADGVYCFSKVPSEVRFRIEKPAAFASEAAMGLVIWGVAIS